MFCLQSHYRKPLEFSYEVLDQMVKTYDKLVRKTRSLKNDGEVDKQVYDAFRLKFEDALCNDVNTSMAITVLYDLLKADTNDATKRKLVEDFDQVLSLGLLSAADEKASEQETNGADNELTAYVEEMIAKRAQAKKEKDFAKADAIRNELLEKGIAIKDTREGVVWERV